MKKYKNYYIGAAVCFFLMCFALDPATDSEDPLVAAIFGVIGVFLLILPPVLKYLEKKEAERKERERIEAKKQAAIAAAIAAQKEQARKNEVRKRALTHFNNSPFVRQVIRDLRSRNWDNMNGKYGHCTVYQDRLVAGRCYYYDEYGLDKLSLERCEELAEFLGMAYGKDYTTKGIYRSNCGPTGTFTSFLGSDGTVSTIPDYFEGKPTLEGYKLKPVMPTLKKW